MSKKSKICMNLYYQNVRLSQEKSVDIVLRVLYKFLLSFCYSER